MFLQFIIPYYGSADLLITAVNSILNQTDTQDIGLIIVDDNHFNDEGKEQSTKACLFLDQHRGGNVELSYIKNEENLGVGKTRNVGLAAADAQYVAFVDSDDEIDSEFVSFFREKLKKHPCNVLIGKYTYQIGEDHYIANFMTWLHAKIYKLSFLRYNGITFPPLRFNEDSGFNFMVYEMTKNIYTVPEDKILYDWKPNPNSLTKTTKGDSYSVEHYVRSMNYGLKHVLNKYEINQTTRIPGTILQVYYYYCTLLYYDHPVTSEIINELIEFFNILRETKWYQLDKVKKELQSWYFINGKDTEVIPPITLAQFISYFEKEPLNFK